jgi:hypothetical protein
MVFTNSQNLRWVADSAKLRGYELQGQSLKICVVQENPICGPTEFCISGQILHYPGISNQQHGVNLEFGVRDYCNRIYRLRIRDDGFTPPNLQYPIGQSFKTVWLVSYDGIRLRVVYGGRRKVSAIYLRPPSCELYDVGMLSQLDIERPAGLWRGVTRTFVVDSLLRRRLERLMLSYGSTYDIGRLGAELSYVIARKRFGLSEVFLKEPSAGGRDLYALNGSVSIQARLLKDLPKWNSGTILRVELLKLISKLRQDSRYNPRMRRGLAVLSREVGDGVIRSLVVDSNFQLRRQAGALG